MSTEKAIDFKQTVIYYIFNNNLSPTWNQSIPDEQIQFMPYIFPCSRRSCIWKYVCLMLRSQYVQYVQYADTAK